MRARQWSCSDHYTWKGEAMRDASLPFGKRDVRPRPCTPHIEALVAKTDGAELKSVLDMVVKIVNYMQMRPLKCRQFV